MSNPPSVSALVLRWQELREQGQVVSAEELCAGCPELLDDVKRQLQALASMSCFLGASSRQTPDASPGPTPDQASLGETARTVVTEAADAVPSGEAAQVGSRYRPLRLHAHGGLGEVFVARDEELSRDVALKRIRRPHAADAGSRRRFLREGEITGSLEHPGVVPVYGLTRAADGQPCYAMRFIRGQTLKEAIERFHASAGADRGLALRQLLARFVAVCNTVAYAHSKGVVHRDLKPANIMLGDYGETLVVDWGLAKRVSRPGETETPEEAGAPPAATDGGDGTATGEVLGTPAFMSPEQAAGRQDVVGPATDVYGLGATLYALLTGRPPFSGGARGEVLRKVQTGDFPLPRKIRPEVPRALEAICLRAMAREPAARYATPLELAADLERWLADEPVSAYRESWTARARRWARRHRTLVMSGVSASLLALLLGGGGGMWLAFRSAETRQSVGADLDEAERLQQEEKWADARAVLERAEGRLGGGGPDDLRQRVRQARANLALVDRLEAIFLDYADPQEHKTSAAAGGRADDAFAGAFAEYGLDVEELRPDAAAELIGGSAIRGRLLAALEQWAYVKGRANRSGWEHLLAVAEGVDSDPWRRQLREAWVRRDRTALRQLITQTDVARLSAVNLVALGRALASAVADHSPETLQALRSVQRAIPGDFVINYGLAFHLVSGAAPQKAESLAFFRTALALRPNSADLQRLLARALEEAGELKEAETAYREFLRFRPDHAEVHSGLGWALWRQGKKTEAVAEYRTAIDLDPGCAPAHNNLAYHLLNEGKLDEALKECDAAIRSQPDYFRPHLNRSAIFIRQKKWPEAEAAAAACLKAQPDTVAAWLNLTAARKEQGRLDAALTAVSESLKQVPKVAALHCARGGILLQQGKEKEAAEDYEQARRILAPNQVYPPLSFGLGVIAYQRGRYAEASTFLAQAVSDREHAEARYYYGLTLAKLGQMQLASMQFQAATRIQKDYAEAHCQLGLALRQTGRFTEAVESLRKGHELGSRDPSWPHPSGEWLREAERLAALERSLPAIMREQLAVAKDDLLTVARICKAKQYNAAAARFYAAAFAAQPTLAENIDAGDRYDAACAAARAGSGMGGTANQLEEDKRALLRRQALDWLRDDLALAGRLLATSTPQARSAISSRLERWRSEADLQEVRDPVKIAKLPRDEHTPWLQLWADWDALLRPPQAGR
jgi:tetratricopeptide (TPR) repeat protein/tRNA A-37 threonylcarbamoyl transferase component Bud32